MASLQPVDPSVKLWWPASPHVDHQVGMQSVRLPVLAVNVAQLNTLTSFMTYTTNIEHPMSSPHNVFAAHDVADIEHDYRQDLS